MSASVPLYTLNKCLVVYDLHEQHRKAIQNNEMNKYEFCDLAELNYDNKFEDKTVRKWIAEYGEDSPEVSRAKNIINTRRGTTVNRYLNAANDYLENVGKGKFPLRSSKDKNKTAD